MNLFQKSVPTINNETFKYKGYRMPVELVNLTGGGIDTWDAIARDHMRQYREYAPISRNDNVLEVGCGVGRDAIQLSKYLSRKGKYIGIDIIKPSINWCQENITPKNKNFKFYFFDVESQIHNNSGGQKTTDIKLPAMDKSIDRIILQSVFTHMFKDDIVHYLREFNRVLKDDGKMLASFFIINSDAKGYINKKIESRSVHGALTFSHSLGSGCYINDRRFPEGAVGYTNKALKEMMTESMLELDQPIHYGFWCGREGHKDGQDIIVMRKKLS